MYDHGPENSTTEISAPKTQGEFTSPPDAFCFSNSIGNLMGALSAAQGEFPIIKKSQEVDFTHNNKRTNYSYADLAKFVEAIMPILSKHGLGVLHPSRSGSGHSVSTFIGHKESGEWMHSDYIKVQTSDNKPQSGGSALTYARRYSLTSFLSLVSEADDDDAQVAGGVEPDKPVPFGSIDSHHTMAAEIMTTHRVHRDDRKTIYDWLIATNHSPDRIKLSTTIEGAAKKAIEKRATKQ